MTNHNTLLNSLSDEELLRHFHAEHDPLTATPIADELAKRFEVLLDSLETLKPWVEVVEEFDAVTPSEARTLLESHPGDCTTMSALLSKLNDHDIHQVDQLIKLIDLADKFRSLASDAGDVFTKLNELISTTQE